MDTMKVESTVWINAPRERVWQAVTDPAQIGQWWPPNQWSIPALKTGETLTFGAAPNTSYAVIEVVEPPHQFAFRWHPTSGATPPGMLTTIVLTEENGGTRVTASQSGFEHLPADTRQQVLERTSNGYRTVVENLKKLIEQ